MTSSYQRLPKFLTSWPTTRPSNGKTGWASPSKWVESYGKDYGIETSSRLQSLIDAGDFPGVPVHRIGDAFMGGLDLAGSLGDRTAVPKDPGKGFDAGSLKAVGMDASGQLHEIPSGSASLLAGLHAPDDAKQNLRARIAQAAALDDGDVLRIAWTTAEGKARIVEYIDSKGQVISPTKEQDLEALAQRKGERHYTKEDLAEDCLRAITTDRKPEPKVVPTEKPVMGSITDRPRRQTPTIMGGSLEANKFAIFDASQAEAAAPRREPDAHSAHLLIVFNEEADFRRKKAERENVDNGTFSLAAGIISSYRTMLGKESSDNGLMDSSSHILFAFRRGDSCQIVGHAPYAGMIPNNDKSHDGAARILIRTNTLSNYENPIDFAFSEVGMSRPNQPVAIARDITTSGFNVPAEARRKIWSIVHTHLGLPTE